MALATTCPKCNTSFRVAPDQLALRRGMVRCGVCQNVFSGMANLRHVDEILRQRSAAQAAAQQALPPAPSGFGPTVAPTAGKQAAGPRERAVERDARPARPTQPPSPPSPPSGGASSRSATARNRSTSADSDDFAHTDLRTAFFLPETVFGPPTRSLPDPVARPEQNDLAAGLSNAPSNAPSNVASNAPSNTSSNAPSGATSNALSRSPQGLPPAAEPSGAPDSAVASGPSEADPVEGRIALRLPGPDTRIRWAQEAAVTAGESQAASERAARTSSSPAAPLPGFPPAPSGPAPEGLPGVAVEGAPRRSAVEGSVADPIAPDSNAAHAVVTDPAAAAAHAAPSQAADTYAAEPHSADPYSADPYSAEPYSAEPHAAESNTAESNTADLHAAGAYSADASVEQNAGALTTPGADLPLAQNSGRRKGRARELDRSDQAIAMFEPEASTIGFSSRAVAFGGLVCVFATLLLIGQLVLGARGTLASLVPSLRAPLQSISAVFGLTVDPPLDLQAVTIESFELQAADVPGQLALSALFRNRANRAVQWPAIELMLTDGQGVLLVRKVILPRDYFAGLPPSAIGQTELGMSPRAELPLKLALEARDVSASGYSVTLFYP